MFCFQFSFDKTIVSVLQVSLHIGSAMANMTMNIKASLGSLQAARFAWFLILLLGGQLVRCEHHMGTNVTIPYDLTDTAAELKEYFCNM